MKANLQVFVANLPWKASEDEVRRLFEDSGEQIENVRILTGDDGRSRGYGFVTFSNGPVNVDQVIEKMNGKELSGRPLLVQPANGVKKRQPA